MRARLLGAAVPAFADAEAITYPALTWNEDGQERRKSVAAEGAPKRVGVEQLPIIDRHHAVAALALNAAQRGAKVLVLRNTVGAAIETMRRLEEQAGLGRSR